jgi:hypothetical protein
LCIQDGVYLRDIVAFSFFRDSIVQVAIEPVGQEPSHGLTELHSEPGSHLCWFETLLRAAFFTSQGQVFGSGAYTLQFGSSIRRRQLVSVRPPEDAQDEEEQGKQEPVEEEDDIGRTRGIGISFLLTTETIDDTANIESSEDDERVARNCMITVAVLLLIMNGLLAYRYYQDKTSASEDADLPLRDLEKGLDASASTQLTHLEDGERSLRNKKSYGRIIVEALLATFKRTERHHHPEQRFHRVHSHCHRKEENDHSDQPTRHTRHHRHPNEGPNSSDEPEQSPHHDHGHRHRHRKEDNDPSRELQESSHRAHRHHKEAIDHCDQPTGHTRNHRHLNEGPSSSDEQEQTPHRTHGHHHHKEENDRSEEPQLRPHHAHDHRHPKEEKEEHHSLRKKASLLVSKWLVQMRQNRNHLRPHHKHHDHNETEHVKQPEQQQRPINVHRHRHRKEGGGPSAEKGLRPLQARRHRH